MRRLRPEHAEETAGGVAEAAWGKVGEAVGAPAAAGCLLVGHCTGRAESSVVQVQDAAVALAILLMSCV